MHTCTCQLSWFSQESPSFSSNLPVLWLEHQISWGKTYHGLFQKFFVNFVMFEKWKRKLKQEVDLVLLFELFLIRKHKTEQSNRWIFNNWSEINQSNCTIHRRKLARLLHAVTYRRRKHSEGLWVIFREYSDIIENDILSIRHLYICHNAPHLLPKILHEHCFQFLLGRL